MPVEISEVPAGQYVEVELSGKLTKEDYAKFVPVVDSAIRERGKVRLLVVMRDFHGWTGGALWEDTKFDIKHFGDIERLALIGDKKWEAGMAAFCKPFTKASIKYFDIGAIEVAQTWIVV